LTRVRARENLAAMATFTNDTEALAFADEHLLYELQMLNYAARQMGNPDQLIVNVSVESFALHLRNWEDFFYPPPVQARKPDDVTYLDYLDQSATPQWTPPPRSTALATAAGMVNKQIAHITKSRHAGVHPGKTWQSNWALEIHALLRGLAQNANLARLSTRLRAVFIGSIGSLPTSGAVAPTTA
jgi:hypothetical protein